MSRSDKTMPVRLQEEDGAIYWQWGGIWRGVKDIRRRYNRQDRQRARRQLRRGDQPFDDQPRGRAQWDCW